METTERLQTMTGEDLAVLADLHVELSEAEAAGNDAWVAACRDQLASFYASFEG